MKFQRSAKYTWTTRSTFSRPSLIFVYSPSEILTFTVEFAGKCYTVNYKSLSWYDAKKYCENHSGHIAIIDNKILLKKGSVSRKLFWWPAFVQLYVARFLRWTDWRRMEMDQWWVLLSVTWLTYVSEEHLWKKVLTTFLLLAFKEIVIYWYQLAGGHGWAFFRPCGTIWPRRSLWI